MKICAPHIGTAYVPLRALFEGLGVEVIVPPPNTRRTMSLGTKYSPEFVCLPYKLVMGNFIEGLEMGADTLLMVEGERICRLGYYMRVMEGALRDLGYDFKLLTTRAFQQPLARLPDVLREFAPEATLPMIWSAMRLALTKLNALDRVEQVVQEVRARELTRGDADRIWRSAIAALDKASSVAQVRAARDRALRELRSVPQNHTDDPLRVGIIGEIYVVLEPFANMEVERELGRLGVHVHRTIMLSDWTKFTLFLSALGMSQHDKAHRAAMPYLSRDVGGDGWESVGETILHARKGFDGMIHLTPFTCMPETIAQNIFISMRKEVDIPVLTITCDEQMGRAGMVTRLEAFVDLLRRRREERRKGWTPTWGLTSAR